MVGRPRLTRVPAGEDDLGRHHPGSVQALDRCLALLEIIAQADGLIIRRVDAPPAAAGDEVEVLLLDA